jgi:hypothetical protein
MNRTTQDFLVAAFGLLTSILIAVIVSWVERHLDIALYSFMFWFIIPAGAIGTGFVAAGGYYLGAVLFGHRPSSLFLFNMVAVSISTFFLIHYLNYSYLEIEGQAVSSLISFGQYLDIVIQHTSLDFRLNAAKLRSSGELGELGYVYALLQIIGFSVGGYAAYRWLLTKPYCADCSKYFAQKGTQTRYAKDPDELTSTVKQISEFLEQAKLSDAIRLHSQLGHIKPLVGEQLRTKIQVRHCKSCHNHWFGFTTQKYSGRNWNDIAELSYYTLTYEQLDISK